MYNNLSGFAEFQHWIFEHNLDLAEEQFENSQRIIELLEEISEKIDAVSQKTTVAVATPEQSFTVSAPLVSKEETTVADTDQAETSAEVAAPEQENTGILSKLKKKITR